MMLNTADFRARARATLPRFVFDYVDGAAEDEDCAARNERDLRAIHLAPQCLRDTTTTDTSVEVFGRRWRAPLGIAPVGLAGLVRPQGDFLLAKAAARLGLPFVLSTASNERLEAVRGCEPSADHWMQLYVMSDRAIAEHIVTRARCSGYGALVLTVDVPVGGMRERDVRNGFRLPFRPGLGTLIDLARHPGWTLAMACSRPTSFVNLESAGNAPSRQTQAALLSRSMDRSLVWESLGWLRRLWPGPLLLKGLMHVNDAKRALASGVDGVIVSNHGGRQLDVAPSTISVLPGIVEAVGGRIPVFVDGGFRRGSDVAKALTLGARAVFLGRPAIWGLASGGEAGVLAALRLVIDELERTMVLLGASSAAALAARGGEHG